jgi:hypothetical protein
VKRRLHRHNDVSPFRVLLRGQFVSNKARRTLELLIGSSSNAIRRSSVHSRSIILAIRYRIFIDIRMPTITTESQTSTRFRTSSPGSVMLEVKPKKVLVYWITSGKMTDKQGVNTTQHHDEKRCHTSVRNLIRPSSNETQESPHKSAVCCDRDDCSAPWSYLKVRSTGIDANLTRFAFILVDEDGFQDLANSCTKLFHWLLGPKWFSTMNETAG